MSDPTVSVVIPTYDRPKKLLRAVKSVLNQSFKNFEIIVVNDFPNNDVRDVLPDRDSLHYIQHDENRGAPVARNNGILAARGEYIALLDDDDIWKPSKLERQLERFDEVSDEYGLVYTGRDIIQENEVVETYIPEHEGWIYSTLLHKNIIPSETPLIRRECFGEIGLFDPGFQSSQDWDLWLRIAKEYKIAAVSESLAVSYEGHSNRISTDMDRKYQGHKQLLEKHKSAFESNPSALAWHKRQLGLFAMQSGRNIEGVNYLLSTYLYNPRDLILLVYLFLGLVPNPFRSWVFDLRDEMIRAYDSHLRWFLSFISSVILAICRGER